MSNNSSRNRYYTYRIKLEKLKHKTLQLVLGAGHMAVKVDEIGQ